jgi:aryl-alcohol dehydrogenase-like predicted oxidoreductase
MKTLPLGKTGVNVSALCLGTMYFGTRNDQAASYSLLDQYVAAGGSFIDTANIYAWWVSGFHGGESETVLGQWMKERRNRAGLFIASKVGFPYQDVPRSTSAASIISECEKSLKRLGVETIDLYYAHCDDRRTPMEEMLMAFDKLVQQGKVRFIGASNHMSWRLEEALWISNDRSMAGYCCIQQRYTYLRPRPGTSFDPQVAVNDDLLDFCRNRQVTLLAYSALLSGAYSHSDRPLPTQYLGSDSEARLNTLRFMAHEKGITENQLILAWMLHSDPLVLPLIAASRPEQMEENLKSLEITLSAEEMNMLNQAGV